MTDLRYKGTPKAIRFGTGQRHIQKHAGSGALRHHHACTRLATSILAELCPPLKLSPVKNKFDEWLARFSKGFDDWQHIETDPATKKAIQRQDRDEVERLAPSVSRSNISDPKRAKAVEKRIKAMSEMDQLIRDRLAAIASRRARASRR